jgi:hypothetical protein
MIPALADWASSDGRLNHAVSARRDIIALHKVHFCYAAIRIYSAESRCYISRSSSAGRPSHGRHLDWLRDLEEQ